MVLTLGVTFDKTIGYGRAPLFDEDATFIHVDISDDEMGKNRTFEVGIVGDIKSVLMEMVKSADKHDFHKPTDWIERLNLARENFLNRVSAAENSDSVPVHPLRICKEVRELFGDDATISIDGGDTVLFSLMAFNHYHPAYFLSTGPVGGIGQGVPFALAGKLARPDKPSVLISGDGAFGYGVIEYDAALKHNLPTITIVFK